MKDHSQDIVSINVIDGIMVVNLYSDLNNSSLEMIQNRVLNQFHSGRARNIILDMAEVLIVDSFIMNKILELVRSVKIMGGIVTVTGMRPEVVITLVSMNSEICNLDTAINVDQGIKQIKTKWIPESQLPNESEQDDIQDTVSN